MSIVCGSFFKTAATSNPFISGIITSRMIRSGLFLRTISKASLPFVACSIRYPASLSSCCNSDRMESSSSTTRIVASFPTILNLDCAICFFNCVTRSSRWTGLPLFDFLAGNANEKVLPLPTALSSQMRPP